MGFVKRKIIKISDKMAAAYQFCCCVVIFNQISFKLNIWIASIKLQFKLEYPMNDNQDGRQNGGHLSVLQTTFNFAYFNAFCALKYALWIAIAKLCTEQIQFFQSFSSIFGHFKTFFLCLREVTFSQIHDCIYQSVNYHEQISGLVLLCEQVSANQPQNC